MKLSINAYIWLQYLPKPKHVNLLKEKLSKYDAPQKVMEAGIYPYFREIESEQDTEVIIRGKRDNIKSLHITRDLLDDGIFVNPVVSPAVPRNDSLIRYSLMATHTFEQVELSIEKITRAARNLGIIN